MASPSPLDRPSAYRQPRSDSAALSHPPVPSSAGAASPSMELLNASGSRMLGADGSQLVRGDDGGMYLRWEPGMTTTTTTHTTTTVTHFPPLRLPLPPAPPLPSLSLASTSSFHVSLPSHLSSTAFPLADTPTPADLQVFPLTVGGRRVLFAEEDPGAPGASRSEAVEEKVRAGWKREREGRGWRRVQSEADGQGVTPEGWGGLERVGLGSALGALGRTSGQQQQLPVTITPPSPVRLSTSQSPAGAFTRTAKGKERAHGQAAAFNPPSPPQTADSPPPDQHLYYPPQQQHPSIVGGSSSPPRKRQRDASQSLADAASSGGGMMVDPTPADGRSSTSTTVVSHSHPPATVSSVHQPSVGGGAELALLQSLPALLESFDALPPKLADHFLMHCLRRSTLPTLQRVSAFISPALKFDFVRHFPPEISIAIFSFVGPAGLANAARVSRRWNEMVECQRGVWVARLKDEGLWWGLGAEEEEEEKIRRRWEVRDLLDAEHQRDWDESRSRGTPRELTAAAAVAPSAWPQPVRSVPTPPPQAHEASSMDGIVGAAAAASSASAAGPADDDRRKRRSHPLKQVYRIRHMTRKNWYRPKPAGKRFMFHGHGAHVVTCLQFDPDKIVSASDDHSINVYAIKDGAPRCRLDGHEGGVWALQYRGDVLVSGSTDRTVRIWSIEKGIQTHVFYGHTSTVIVEPVLQPNGEFLPPYPLVVTGSRDSTIRVWRLPGKGEPEFRPTDGGKGSNPYKSDDPVPPHENPFHNHCLEGHTNAVRAIAAHGRYCVSGSYDCTVRVWDIVRGTCLHVLRGHQQKVYSVVIDSRRGRVASGSMDGTVKVWDLVSGVCLATLEGHVSLVGLLGMSPNTLVSAAADSTIKVWNAQTLECKQTLTAHAGAITCFQHDETKIISGSEGTLKMWDIRDGSFVRDIVTGVQGVWQVAFSGRYLVSASNRIGLTVFDVVDFGDCGWDDGAGDESLDALVVPEWERRNRLEPRQYQEDDEDPMTLDTFSSPTAGGSSRRQRVTSDDLSSPEPGETPWTAHPSAVPSAAPSSASASLSAGGGGGLAAQPPITPQRSASHSASVTHNGHAHAGQLAAAQDDASYRSPSGYGAPPPAATSHASPSFDRKSSGAGAAVGHSASHRPSSHASRSTRAAEPLAKQASLDRYAARKQTVMDQLAAKSSRREDAGPSTAGVSASGGMIGSHRGGAAWQSGLPSGPKVLRRAGQSVKYVKPGADEGPMDDDDDGDGQEADDDQPMSDDV